MTGMPLSSFNPYAQQQQAQQEEWARQQQMADLQRQVSPSFSRFDARLTRYTGGGDAVHAASTTRSAAADATGRIHATTAALPTATTIRLPTATPTATTTTTARPTTDSVRIQQPLLRLCAGRLDSSTTSSGGVRSSCGTGRCVSCSFAGEAACPTTSAKGRWEECRVGEIVGRWRWTGHVWEYWKHEDARVSLFHPFFESDNLTSLRFQSIHSTNGCAECSSYWSTESVWILRLVRNAARCSDATSSTDWSEWHCRESFALAHRSWLTRAMRQGNNPFFTI